MKQARTAATLWLGILLACCPSGFPLNPSLDVSQFAHTAWTTQEGSLKAGVRCIAQTPDGYLWVGTEFGLLRFDGVRFVQWNPPVGQHLPSNNIRSLAAAHDGTLWIGTVEGLASWKDGKLTEYAGLSHENVVTLLQDRDGTVWAGSFHVPKGKLCAVHNGALQCYGEDGRLGQWIWSLYEDSAGQLWVGTQTGLWRWKPGPPKRYSLPHPIETPEAVVEDDNRKGLFAVCEGIWHLVDEKVADYKMATPPGRTTPVNIFRDHDGGLWVGTLQRGVMHVQQGRTSIFAQSDGLSSDRVSTLFEDREGNIWVGTTDGLDRFRETSVTSISVKQGLSNPSVLSVLVARNNSVWLSTLDALNKWNSGDVTIYWPAGGSARENARLRATQQGTAAFYTIGKDSVTDVTDPQLPDTTVGSLYEDNRGRIWVSTPKGITRFENGRFSLVKEVPPGWVNAITGDGNTGIWISYQDLGLVHWIDRNVVERFPWSTFGGNVVASAVMPDPVRGGLWLGFFQGGLLHFRDGQIRESYGKNEGLGIGRVMGLQRDDNGTIWAATEGGLSRLNDGKVLTLNASNGLPCDTIHWAVQNDNFFWLYTACGLVRVAQDEMQRWAADPKSAVHVTVLGRSDGVRSRALLAGYTPRVSQSRDGRLWFANLESVSVVDPRHLIVNAVAPPVHIEQVIADGNTYDPHDGLRLPARVRDLTIDYTALSFAAPEKVRFRIKLDGQDKDWRELVNDRTVHYTNLPPKRYQFHVLACNNSGLWNDAGATLQFLIPPAWYQTNWFFVLCVAAVLAMIWCIHEFRLREVAAQFNMRLEERVSERTRIARDLHDTLLQSFQGLVLRFQAARNQLPNRPEQACEALDGALVSADQALAEGRSAIQELRSGTFTEATLQQMLLATGRELASSRNGGSTGPALRVIVEGRIRPKRLVIKEEIYRIARELLRNAYRHAHAHSIEAELRYDNDAFLLLVRDDGKGIDPKVVKDHGRVGHWGLPGIYERAEGIGARLDFWSEAGAGTEVRLTIPAAIAYEKSGDEGGFKLFRKTRSYEHRS